MWFRRSGVQTFLLVKKRHKKESSLVDRRGSNVNADSNIKRLQWELELEESKQWPNLNRLLILQTDLETAFNEEEAFWK